MGPPFQTHLACDRTTFDCMCLSFMYSWSYIHLESTLYMYPRALSGWRLGLHFGMVVTEVVYMGLDYGHQRRCLEI